MVLSTPPQDFLTAEPVMGPDEKPSDHWMREQYNMLRRIRMELLKQNASVLTSVVVQNASQNVIGDQAVHQIFFQSAGKNVTIYKLIAFSAVFTSWVLNLVNPPANNFDGILMAANTIYQFPNINLQTIYVKAAAAPPPGASVNGPAVTQGGLFVLGFTVPDPASPDWE